MRDVGVRTNSYSSGYKVHIKTIKTPGGIILNFNYIKLKKKTICPNWAI